MLTWTFFYSQDKFKIRIQNFQNLNFGSKTKSPKRKILIFADFDSLRNTVSYESGFKLGHF